ncbi:phosphoenolpyruvate synthase [Aeropyrum pernix]|uniref:Phosphoenolpyruvate synthase n=1 Tax=Aeropyrum pernix TaxID=56636 RepID=A0A401H894_AERPX|nr:pyruvate, water dikinase [Aeropyrum pernix]GBF08610.1 phosphoenolpyruvate synthase [Aeropyrum pernix]
MCVEKRLILWLDEISKDLLPLVGGKAAGLGEMIKAGIPVPPGFVVTSEAYRRFVFETGIAGFIKHILEETIVSGRPEEYEKASELIRSKFVRTPMPPYLRRAIVDAYRKLGTLVGVEEPRVAVRSSATVEDLPEASFAGQQETYLNVKGEEEVVEKVKTAWASLWTARALSYRDSLNIDHETALMAVVVQKMVNSRSSGVMFTIHPVTGEEDKIVIESIWGLGEYIVGGKVTPDRFVVSKSDLEILEARISRKDKALFYDPDLNENVEIKVPETGEELEDLRRKHPAVAEVVEKHGIRPDAPSLSEKEVKELARLAIKVENHFARPMDIEWAIDFELSPPENILLLQARPETVWSRKKEEAEAKPPEDEAVPEGEVLVRGVPASPGVASGRVKIALTVEEAAKKMEKGDVLVTKMTDPDWVPYMKMASAIVTDEGGMTAHAAIVARELGIPAVVGTGDATKKLKDGMLVTVDGSRGVVYAGAVKTEEAREEARPELGAAVAEVLSEVYPVTATKIYMNLGHPEEIDRYKHLPFEGIGLMRIEFIISSWIGYHPMYLIEQGRGVYFIDKLAEGVAKVASAIYPRPVVVRFSDFKTNEYRRLKGGEKYETLDERNPMIGWRGVSRYIHPNYEPAFRLEVRAIKKVREEWGLKNVWVMFPFVRTTWELERALKIMEEEGLGRGRDFKVWIMVEVPSTVFLADEFAKMVDGFSIGSNDLTQLVLGVDRDSGFLAKMGYFDERDPAVLRSIEILIEKAHSQGATVSICGQGPSVYPELVEFLVRRGIDSISVNPDAVVRVRRQVASIERRIMLERLEELGSRLSRL